MKSRQHNLLRGLLVVVLLLLLNNTSFGQTTSFTYQGKLSDNGAPVNAFYDFTLTLWDASTNGLQVGSSLTLPNTPVVNGIFTVQLDFGVTAFNGANRYLEITVKPSGNPAILPTLLTPRQQVMSTPYAIKSLGAASADSLSVGCVNCVTSSQIASVSGNAVTGTIPVTSVPAGSANYIQNSATLQAASNFNISGTGKANTLDVTTQYNLGGSRILGNAGANNLFVGINAGAVNTGGSNSFFGSQAGQNNTTGSSNTFLGKDAGKANTNGNSNAFFGTNAGVANFTGSLNAFFGANAGQANSTGANNSFFGFNAGFTSTGNNNSFFGSGAGRNNGTGFNNAFFGYQAGFNNIGNSNAFFGNVAGFANNSGNNNSFFGAGSGGNNTSGTSNSFFGKEAGRDNSNGNQNAFLGYQAGLNNTSGNDNAFVGTSAGAGTSTGSSNSFFGTNAGTTNDGGSSNTIIGAEANVSVSSLINATAIGFRAAVGQNNSLVLGSINGVNGATADTKVGIGTTAPTEPLTIKISGNISGGVYGWSHTNGDIIMGSRVGGTGAQPYGGWIGTKTNHPLNFFINNSSSAAMTLDTSGFLRLNNVDSGGSGPSLCINASNRISFCSSSLRYKTDLQTFTGGLNVINRLRPITFTWKVGGMRDVGFGAEEVAAVEPLLTFRNPKGEIEGVKYGQISAVLVNAIKEQQAQIEAQNHKEALLQEELENLKQIICTDHPQTAICKSKKDMK